METFICHRFSMRSILQLEAEFVESSKEFKNFFQIFRRLEQNQITYVPPRAFHNLHQLKRL